MLPDDANFAGNVHGGTLLKLIEEAGGIVARRYMNDKVRWGHYVLRKER